MVSARHRPSTGRFGEITGEVVGDAAAPEVPGAGSFLGMVTGDILSLPADLAVDSLCTPDPTPKQPSLPPIFNPPLPSEYPVCT